MREGTHRIPKSFHYSCISCRVSIKDKPDRRGIAFVYIIRACGFTLTADVSAILVFNRNELPMPLYQKLETTDFCDMTDHALPAIAVLIGVRIHLRPLDTYKYQTGSRAVDCRGFEKSLVMKSHAPYEQTRRGSNDSVRVATRTSHVKHSEMTFNGARLVVRVPNVVAGVL